MAELRPRINLDLTDQARLAELTRPGEDSNSALTRLLLAALDGATARHQITKEANDYSAALAGSADPDAAAWAEALTWITTRISGGAAGIRAHHQFVRRFGVDPSGKQKAAPDSGT
ncbi:MAG: hypothetical protein JWN52_5096 [Actinomycetia bacterium]|nr:hypothetical protein [Actinomycetes bacterium]